MFLGADPVFWRTGSAINNLRQTRVLQREGYVGGGRQSLVFQEFLNVYETLQSGAI